MHGQRSNLRRVVAALATGGVLIGATLFAAAPAVFATPSVTITSPENDQTVTNAVLTVEGTFSGVTGTASGTVALNGGSPAAVTIAGTSFSASVDLAAGANSITVTITDNNQQTGSTSGTASVSVTLQTVPVVSVGTATVSGTTVSFSGTVSDTSVTQATVIWDGLPLKAIAVSGGSFSSFVQATDGSHTLAISATNATGTGTSSGQTVTVGSAASGSGSSGSSPSSTSTSSSAGAAGTSVGPTGGNLATADGTLNMTIPAGAVPAGATFSATTTTTPPANAPSLPAGASTASPYIVLSGATLASPVAATIKYDASALGGLPPQRLGVFADGAWHYLPTAVDAASGTVTADVAGPGTIVVLADTVQLSDVPAGYWAASSIATLLGAQVISGYPDGTFRPDAAVTRAEFAKMLDLTLGVAPATTAAGAATSFADVPAGAWYAPYVAAAAGAGLMDGVSATSFAPDATMTREQMAVALQRALKLSGGGALTFTDAASIDSWAQAGVAAAVAAGYMAGFPDGSFRPLAPTTRAQAAQVLAAVIAHLAP